MEYVSIKKLDSIIKKNLYKIPNDIDLIVANPRSGLIPATIISLLKNIPLCDINCLKANEMFESGITKNKTNFISNVNEANHILVVDDSSYSGSALDIIKKKIPESLLGKITTLVIIANENTKDKWNIYFEEINGIRIFEWNLFHHRYLNYGAIDINVILKDNAFVIKPTQIINSIIIPNDMDKKKVAYKLNANNIKYKKILFKDELLISDFEFLITNNIQEYKELKVDKIDFNNGILIKSSIQSDENV